MENIELKNNRDGGVLGSEFFLEEWKNQENSIFANGAGVFAKCSSKSPVLEDKFKSGVVIDEVIFIMDMGGNYKNICEVLDIEGRASYVFRVRSGEIIRFNSDNKISLNPFVTLNNSGAGSEAQEMDGIELLEIKSNVIGSGSSDSGSDAEKCKTHFVTKDSVIYAKSMIAAMCGVSNQGRGEALIERAIIDGIAMHGNDLDITKLAEVLENLRDKRGDVIAEAMVMADSLCPYTNGGIHGRFFAAGETASFKDGLTALELHDLVNDEKLLSEVLQVILLQSRCNDNRVKTGGSLVIQRLF